MKKHATLRERWPVYAITLAIVTLSAALTIHIRDTEIQAERDESERIIDDFVHRVRKADIELRALESQVIALSVLDTISTLQAEIANRAKLIIGLAPILNNPEKVDQASKSSVDSYLRHERLYNSNIVAYQSQMSKLNNIVNRANKQYAIKVIRPSYLDRASLSSRRKFNEIIGLAQAPNLAPSTEIETINKGISSRSEKQKAIRTKWNSKALKINETNKTVNSLLREISRLFPPEKFQKSISIKPVVNVKMVD
jgi:hypothetical protein